MHCELIRLLGFAGCTHVTTANWLVGDYHVILAYGAATERREDMRIALAGGASCSGSAKPCDSIGL